jgi:hypothetical protein
VSSWIRLKPLRMILIADVSEVFLVGSTARTFLARGSVFSTASVPVQPRCADVQVRCAAQDSLGQSFQSLRFC